MTAARANTFVPVSQEVSVRINAARLICVLMMMYVHVPDGQQTVSLIDTSADTRLDHWLESMMIEGPGRASAALLSVVSGYLAALTLLQGKVSANSLNRRRFKSIVLPMLFWSVLTCTVYLALGQSDALLARPDSTWLDKLNLIFFLTQAPDGPTMHLGFLRDLFVCVLFSPLIILLLKRLPLATMALLLAVYLFEHSGQLVIILRPLVIFGFSFGMLLALRRLPLQALDSYWPWFLSLTGVFAVLITWTDAGLFLQWKPYLAMHGVSVQETVLYPLCRFFGSLAIWTMLSLISVKAMQRISSTYSKYLFAAFCSHFLVLTLLFNGLWLPLIGDRDAYAYLLWFAAAPAISMVAAILMVELAGIVCLPMARLMTGGRVPGFNAMTNEQSRLASIWQWLPRIKKPRQIPAGAQHP